MQAINRPRIIGIIGGGQLGRMLIEFGIRKLPGYNTSLIRVLNPLPECSVAALNDHNISIVCGSYNDPVALRTFANGCDIITFEIEHIDADELENISEDYRVEVIPRPNVLKIIQDKGAQKQHYVEATIPSSDFVLSDDPDNDFWDTDVHNRIQAKLSGLVVFKARRNGYDGRGVSIVSNMHQVPNHLKTDIIIEKFIEGCHEVSVIVAIDTQFNLVCYEPTLMKFHDEKNVLHTCETATGVLGFNILNQCKEVARETALSFRSPGLFAVEMFVTDDQILVNETAPRVHNSGHHTIHTTTISQFEMLARILIGEQVQQPIEHSPNYIMRNLYPSSYDSENLAHHVVNHMCVSDPNKGPFFVDYGKKTVTAWRKMGHITHVGLKAAEEEQWYRLNAVIEYETGEIDWPKKVGIIMGSESDWSVMQDACSLLQEFHIGYEVTVVSAHRTPDRLTEYAKTAMQRGICVIIAGAGGAAHLPGMIAANTVIPVIGVPIKTVSLNGLDSLYSIVQMPPGVPVACMAINGARNAGIFAAQILGAFNEVINFRIEIERSVLETACFRTRKIN